MSHPSPISQLAQELVDKIIDDLAESLEDVRFKNYRRLYLSHCSLVCKSFLPRSQYHLFRRIKIESEGAFQHEFTIKRCQELGRILTQSPHIATYVRELHLEIQPDDKIGLHETPIFMQAINQIAQVHRPIDKLTLGGFRKSQLRDPQGFLDAFTRPFISPFITSLHIHKINDAPIRMIQECVNLSALTLTLADLECDSTPNPSRKYVPRPRLRSLKYLESPGAIAKLIGRGFTYHPIHLSTLRALTTYIDELEDILCARSILKATNSLEELYLETEGNVCYPPDYRKKHVSLDGHINLKKSKLRILHANVVFGPSDDERLSGIHSMLKTVPAVNSLQEFHLSVYVGFVTNVGPEGLLDADWESLAALIGKIASGKAFAFQLLFHFLDNENTSRETEEQYSRMGIASYICENQLRGLCGELLQILDPAITLSTDFDIVYHNYFGTYYNTRLSTPPMSEAPVYRLSQELFDRIIDGLAEWLGGLVQRTQCLSYCSLICKYFLPRSQFHLFHRVKIESGGSFDHERCIRRCTELSRIVKQNPNIVTYIHELQLRVPSDDNVWIHQNASFLQVMDQLSQAKRPLERLILTSRFGACQLGDPQGFLDGFARPFISPFITSLHIQGIKNAPIRMIQECVNLCDITLRHADLERDSGSNPSRHHIPRPRLCRLKYINSHGAIEKLTGKGFTYHPIHLSALRTLTIFTDRIEDVLCGQDIIKATNSLEELYLETQGNLKSNSMLEKHVSLERRIRIKSPNLRILHVNVVFGLSQDERLSGIISILKTVPTVNSLQSFRLSVYVGFATEVGPESLLDADWESLATQIQKISSGKALAFHISFHFLDNENISRRRERQAQRMKFAHSLCENQLHRLVKERLGILRKDTIIALSTDLNIVYHNARWIR
ncbi:hypothetical protein M413DRAFT_32316 [Hebeloma cylindrosporum]|uniref:Uncharacterized protein n=1 Tax=Hebeloma cylindrosporum TaxID=76867 RepID=A0A0C3BW92_HEBCY|nr:hypothetical protein M413DRAFT_32316 [Hebeloma cylindrosporum h7]